MNAVPHCAYCGSQMPYCTCYAATTTVTPPVLPPTRFVKRYGYMVCSICGMVEGYCKGHAPSDPPSPDGAESGLAKRIRDARGGR